MQVAYETLRLLSDGKFHSGTFLAQQLKVSRSSIWKGVAFLRTLKVKIQAVSGRGYRWIEPVELLNKKEILSFLTSQAQSSFARIDIVNVTASTNDYLIERLGHFPSGAVCIAEAQTAGKGRMGKTWHSPFGANIYLSFYWRFACKLHDLSGLSLAIGIAILEAIKEITPIPDELGIKWPNDIWYCGAKLCGILVESLGNIGNSGNLQQSTGTDVIIGIGMNVSMTGSDPENTWANLKQILGCVPSRNKVIGKILNALVKAIEKFQTFGFAAFMEDWACYDLLAGKTVTLSNGTQTEVGVVQGVNERGELCVKIGVTLKAVRYAEVSVRPENQTHEVNE